MTCHSALALLEEYLDGGLSEPQAVSISEHIDRCETCREEYDSLVLLRELLKQRTAPDPGPDYWRETSSLIRARTVESDSLKIVQLSVAQKADIQRGAFMRAVLSVAASLVVLFSAILLGSSQQGQLARVSSSQSPLLVKSGILERVQTDNIVRLTNDNSRLAKGILLVGPPGSLGRFVVQTDITLVAR